jgi:hypothetical protein
MANSIESDAPQQEIFTNNDASLNPDFFTQEQAQGLDTGSAFISVGPFQDGNQGSGTSEPVDLALDQGLNLTDLQPSALPNNSATASTSTNLTPESDFNFSLDGAVAIAVGPPRIAALSDQSTADAVANGALPTDFAKSGGLSPQQQSNALAQGLNNTQLGVTDQKIAQLPPVNMGLEASDITNIQNSADPAAEANRAADATVTLLNESAPGRASLTAELDAAIASGASANDLKSTELARVAAAGGDLGALGLPQPQIAGLPKNVVEPTNTAVGSHGTAVKDFFTNASGEVKQLTNAYVDPSTRNVIAPFPSSKDLIQAGDSETKLAALDKGMSLSGNALPAVGPSKLLAGAGDKNPSSSLSNHDIAIDKARAAVQNSAFGKDPANQELVNRLRAVDVKRVEGLGMEGLAKKNADEYLPYAYGGKMIKKGEFEIQVNAGLTGNPALAAQTLLHETVHVLQTEKNKDGQGTTPNIQREVEAFSTEMKLWKENRTQFIDANGAPKKNLTTYQQGVVSSSEKIYQAELNGGKAGIKKEIMSYEAYRDMPDLDRKNNWKGQFITVPAWGLPF